MNKFEEDVELRAMKKLAGLKFTDCNRFLGIIPKTLVEKVAMIKLAVMFDDIIPVQYRSDNAMGKFTAKQQQNLVAQGKMPSKRIIMDHMRRSGYHHMDNIGAITLDFNDMTGNLGAISKARHKLIPHLSVGNVADKDFLANIIIEYLNRETNNGITRSLGEVAANALNHYKNMNNNIAFNQVDIENAEKLCKILGIQEESDLIPNIFKDRNKARILLSL